MALFESTTWSPLTDITEAAAVIAFLLVVSATELPGITSAGTTEAKVKVAPPRAVVWAAVVGRRESRHCRHRRR